MEHSTYDILIVGAGPVGLFAANVFGKQGLKVLLIEQFPSKIRYPRAIGIDAEVLRTIQSVGLFEELEPLIHPLKRLQLLHADYKVLVDTSFTSKGCKEEGTYLFYQPELESILENGISRFKNVEIRYENCLLDIQDTGRKNPVTCTLQNELAETITIKTKFLIGCDGANSLVKKLMKFEEKNLNYEGYILKIDAEAISIKALSFDTTIAQKYASLDKPWVRMLGRGKHCRWEFQIKEKDVSDDLLSHHAALEHIRRTGEDINNLTIINSALYKFRSAYNKDWQMNNVFVAGDAAHVTPPYVGQGMCAGFRDIANLSWKIKEVLDNNSHRSILETYKTERIPNIRFFIYLAILVGHLFKTRLYYLVVILTKLPFVKKLLTTMKLKQPGTGKGYFAKGKLARKLIPQTILALSDNTEILSDNWLNNKWTLLCINGLNKDSQLKANQLGIAVKTVSKTNDRKEVILNWMKKNKVEAIIIRPDRYIFSSGNNPDKLLATYEKIRKTA